MAQWLPFVKKIIRKRECSKKGIGGYGRYGDELRKPSSFTGVFFSHLHYPHICWFFLFFPLCALPAKRGARCRRYGPSLRTVRFQLQPPISYSQGVALG